jgi:signal transduction histidine kinase
MFTKARITLTGWYVLIIMLISVLFSLAVYRGATLELERGMRRQVLRTMPGVFPPGILPDLSDFDSQIFAEAERHIFYDLVLVNSAILITSAGAAYFLAGKTLNPIERMVEEQKRFVADASHELRTPLTAMKTEIEVTLRDRELDVKQAKEMLKSNLEEVDKMQSLSNHLLMLSRYQDTNIKYNFTKVRLDNLLSSVIEKLTVLADKKHIRISYSAKDTDAEVVDTSMTELFTILLDNAIKYSKNDEPITVSLRSNQHYATIQVKDTGVGIKASDLPFIFNRFYRADSSRNKNQTDGYGLGLSIAKSIVDLHQGRIWAESTVDTGTEFFVKLPLKHKKQVI